MSLLRYDITTNDWVISPRIGPWRPDDFKKRAVAEASVAGLCPFCPGNEHLTGPEIFALRDNSAANTRAFH